MTPHSGAGGAEGDPRAADHRAAHLAPVGPVHQAHSRQPPHRAAAGAQVGHCGAAVRVQGAQAFLTVSMNLLLQWRSALELHRE